MDPRIPAALRRVLTTGEQLVDVEFVGETPGVTGERNISASIFPVRADDGRIVGLGATVLDVTERRRAEAERRHALELERSARAEAEAAAQRARFLAEASVILDESLDYESTLQTIAQLAVPWVSDWCAVDIVDLDGTTRRVATAHVDPAKVEFAAEVERRYPTDPESATGVPNVIRTARSEIYPDIPDELPVQGARDEEHLRLIRSIGMRSAMIVPMVARGRTLGAITLVAA